MHGYAGRIVIFVSGVTVSNFHILPTVLPFTNSINHMKNFRYLPLPVRSAALAFLFILASLVACKKDSDPAPTGVQGSWQMTAINISPAFFGITDYLATYTLTGDTCPSQITFVFNENGSVNINAPASCNDTRDELMELIGINNSTTWAVDGNKLTLTTGGAALDLNLTVDASAMSLAATDIPLQDGANHTITFVFKRV